MEVLIQKLSLQSQNRDSSIGFKIHPQTANIPCLMFADDILLFCKASDNACRNLKTTLDEFYNLPCGLVNFHKSSVIFSKHVQTSKETILAKQFNILPKSSLGQYLGIFFSSFHPTKTYLNSVLSKIEQRINLWEFEFLSKAGRITLIQTNLESLPSYTCSSTVLSSDTAKSIDIIHRKYFWR